MPGLLIDTPVGDRDMSSMNRSKRALDLDSAAQHGPVKRRKIQQHAVRHKQQLFPGHPVTAAVQAVSPQDDNPLFRTQLTRAITVSMTAVGFQSATNSALEAVTAHVEEYMLNFLAHVKSAMYTGRRDSPTPSDFARALAAHNLTPSSLLTHASLPIPPAVTQRPFLPPLPPLPDSLPPPNLDPVLGPALSGAEEKAQKRYIPAHFPALPSKHTYQATPVFPTRDRDPRSVRSKATEEGILAEQALRKLMARRRGGAGRKESVPSIAHSGEKEHELLKAERIWEETVKLLVADDEQEEVERKEKERQLANGVDELDMAFGFEGTDGGGGAEPPAPTEEQRREKQAERERLAKEREEEIEGSMVVNWEQRYWSKGASKQRM